MISTLVTHDGKFHADEVFSSAILTGLYPDATLVRSRDTDLIRPAAGRIVYDVGGRYDPDLGLFDHHQMGAPIREDGTPYSSFGLVWEHYGQAWLREVMAVSPEDLDAVHRAVHRSFVREVDALDNGKTIPGAGSPLNISRLVETLSPDFDDETPDGMTAAFSSALKMFGEMFSHYVRTTSAKIRATRIVSEILSTHDGSPILELPYGMPWEGAVRKMGADHILLAVIPRDGEWTLSTVRSNPRSFENRLDLPAAWAGLTHAALAEVTGVDDAKFAHRERFFAVAGSRAGILEMARLALVLRPETAADPSVPAL